MSCLIGFVDSFVATSIFGRVFLVISITACTMPAFLSAHVGSPCQGERDLPLFEFVRYMRYSSEGNVPFSSVFTAIVTCAPPALLRC
jgi:hypothetical protein